VIPYSNKINWALDRTRCDTIVYLDNGSMPDPDKYKTMFVTINHRDVGAVYCGQKRTGYLDETSVADKIIDGANGVLNYTQVMHRKTADRWPLDLRYADPDIADGVFWDLLHKRLGSFHPAGSRVLDEHHMPEPKAQGI
jgi:hypothetical protein